VAAALRLMQEAAPHVDLPAACQQLLALQSYEGVIRVCAACAKAVDPYDLGLKQYKVHFLGNKSILYILTENLQNY
jgi:hypothetical protein